MYLFYQGRVFEVWPLFIMGGTYLEVAFNTGFIVSELFGSFKCRL